MMTALYESDQETPAAFERHAEMAYETMRLSVDFRPGETLPTSRRSSFFRTLDRTLRSALSAQIDNDFWFDTTRYPSYVDVRVEVEGGVLRYIALRERVFATTGHIFLLWIIGATTLLTAVSIVFIRNQVKPIRRLADAGGTIRPRSGCRSFPPRRRDRGAPGGPRLPGDARAHPSPPGTAHGPAGRGQP